MSSGKGLSVLSRQGLLTQEGEGKKERERIE